MSVNYCNNAGWKDEGDPEEIPYRAICAALAGDTTHSII